MTSPTEAAALLESAWGLYAKGDRPGALDAARQAVAVEPALSAAQAALGYFLFDQGRDADALAVLDATLLSDAACAPLHWYRGLVLQRQGRAADAADALRQACMLDASLDEAAFTLAWLLHDQGQWEEAAAWSQRALAASRMPARLLQTGWLRHRQGELAAAAGLYREALERSAPDAADVPRLCLHLAQCLREMQDLPTAQATLEHGLRASPGQVELLMEKGWLLRTTGDPHAALITARELTEAASDRADAWFLRAVLEHDLGQLQDADGSYARAHELQPGHVQALVRRARVLRELGQMEGARWVHGMAAGLAPDDPANLDMLAQLMLDQGEFAQARRSLVQRLRAAPGVPGASDRWRLLAAAHVQAGRPRAARQAIARALRLAPGNVEALRAMGWLALELGDKAGAVHAARRLLAAVPNDAIALLQSAFIFSAADEPHDAQACAEQAVALAPEEPEAWRALSQVRARQGRWTEAQFAAREAVRLAPQRAAGFRQLGWAHLGAHEHGLAQLAFLRAMELAPGDDSLTLELGEAQRRGGRPDTAEAAARALLARRARWAPALLLLARSLRDRADAHALGAAVNAVQTLAVRPSAHQQEALRLLLELEALGRTEVSQVLQMVPATMLHKAWREAIEEACHTRSSRWLVALAEAALRRFPEDAWFLTANVYAASFLAGATADRLARLARDASRAWKIQGGLAPLDWAGRPDRARRLPRLAYLASQRHEPLLRRVLAAHDPRMVEVFLFSTFPISGLPGHVHQQVLVPEALESLCTSNRIDLAVDAGGLHPLEGQGKLLAAYARRVAPVQAGWLGSWGSAGGLFDVLVTDDVAVPAAHAVRYEEEIVHLSGGQWCWDPPPAPAPNALPLLARGVPAFGVVARSLRWNAACMAAWARLLAAVPGATLRCIGDVAHDRALQGELLAACDREGVDRVRVEFDNFRPEPGFLAWCQDIDVVLDSFPGSGGLSLLGPLWMGVPVVSLAGDWAGARQGASILSAIGLPECIVPDTEGYVRVAAGLVRDPAALSVLRAGLRGRMLSSGLLDGRRVAAQIEGLAERAALGGATAHAAGVSDPKARIRRHADHALDAWLRQPHTITMPPATDRPDLSVVVVLYNQAGLSRRMLQALADQQGVAFETVIVDNASSDRTQDLLERVVGARMVRNARNQGFLLAAKQGAALARGRILVLLNSDAFLQAGALQAVVEAMDADRSIGALGGRIVLTAGGLQEAGNEIFRDGSTGGVGRHEDPWGPMARTQRSTDYVSGVLLATPRPLWDMLGGFDEAFAPAYYEDADYCLRVWRAGFRCVVEPRVLVEHVEWGSAVGDSATALMQRHRGIFIERHGQWLAGQRRPQPLRLDVDGWRSPQDRPRRRPRVLMLDNEVPHMFKGGGLPRARLMLQALAGWPVTFFPLWFTEDTWPEVQALLPPSMEVTLGVGLAGLEAFLARRRGVYDVVLVSRPPNLAAVADLRRRRPDLWAGMRLVYDAEALFALREIAQAGVLGTPLPRRDARRKVADEVALARDASDVIVVSERDAAHYRAAGLRTHVLAHPVPVRRSAPGAAGRAGLLFVGALHPGTPNEDGLLWFVDEVLPRLDARWALQPVLRVVGVCLSERVAALRHPQVQVLGPQPELDAFYDAARVFVAPARFAGGVPLKVIEAAAQGIPVVASRLLVRQLQWREGQDVIGARNADVFAAGVAQLLTDDALWQRQQSCAWTQCEERYDPRVFGDTFRRLLDPGLP